MAPETLDKSTINGDAGPGDDIDDIAAAILDAASRRFLHYGFGKTTMSEIAKDCNMSTGNLYRYYPSKMDIAESFVRRLRRDHLGKLKTIIDEPQGGVADKLRALLRDKFRIAYERFHDRPKAYELSAAIMNDRPAFASEWEAAESGLIVELLARGENEGLWAIHDKARTARIIQDMVYRFTSPAVFHEGDYDALAGELDDIVDMILDAFAWRVRLKS